MGNIAAHSRNIWGPVILARDEQSPVAEKDDEEVDHVLNDIQVLGVILGLGLLLENTLDPLLHAKAVNHRRQHAARVADHESRLQQEDIAEVRDVSLVDAAVCAGLVAQTQTVSDPHARLHLREPCTHTEREVKHGHQVVLRTILVVPWHRPLAHETRLHDELPCRKAKKGLELLDRHRLAALDQPRQGVVKAVMEADGLFFHHKPDNL